MHDEIAKFCLLVIRQLLPFAANYLSRYPFGAILTVLERTRSLL